MLRDLWIIIGSYADEAEYFMLSALPEFPKRQQKTNDVMEAVGENGHVHILQWLIEEGLNINAGLICVCAAKKDQTAILRILLEHKRLDQVIIDDAAQVAAANGSADFVSDMIERVSDKGSVLLTALRNGQKTVAMMPQFQPIEWHHKEFLEAAAEGGNVELVDMGIKTWDSRFTPFGRMQNAAAKGGHIPMLSHLFALCPPDVGEKVDIMRDVAGSGRVPVMKWLLEQKGFSLQDDHPPLCMIRATQPQSLDMLKFLKSAGAQWSTTVCMQAVVWKNLPALRWLREYRDETGAWAPCPWDSSSILMAAYYTNFEFMKYCRTFRNLVDGTPDPCPWDMGIYRELIYYARSGEEFVTAAEWLRNPPDGLEGLPVDVETANLASAEQTKPKIAEWGQKMLALLTAET